MHVIKLEVMGETNIPELQDLLMKCSDYLTFQDGKPVEKDAAKDLLLTKPDAVSFDDKIVFGIYMSDNHSLIGVIDIIMRYAGPDILSLGLLVIEPSCRGKGIGENTHKLLEAWAGVNNFSRIRLGVLFDNDKGLSFWQRIGYKETGEVKPYHSHTFRVMEKPI